MNRICPFAASLFMGSLMVLIGSQVMAQQEQNRFYPLEDTWRPPNECRLASGAPGPDYWQQQVDYQIAVEILEETPPGPTIKGEETITYHNNSPHTLDYLWVQLDQNLRRPDSKQHLMEPAPYVYRPESFDNIYHRQNDFKVHS